MVAAPGHRILSVFVVATMGEGLEIGKLHQELCRSIQESQNVEAGPELKRQCLEGPCAC